MLEKAYGKRDGTGIKTPTVTSKVAPSWDNVVMVKPFSTLAIHRGHHGRTTTAVEMTRVDREGLVLDGWRA